MSLFVTNASPSSRQLRQFACLLLLIVGGIACWKAGSIAHAAWIVVPVGIFVAIGWFWPVVLKPLFVGLVMASAPLAFVAGEVILFVMYFLVILPVGLIQRIFGRDALRLKRSEDVTRKTYWEEVSKSPAVESYFRQF